MKDIGDIVARGKPHFVGRSSVEMDHHVLDHLSFLDVLLQLDNAARGDISRSCILPGAPASVHGTRRMSLTTVNEDDRAAGRAMPVEGTQGQRWHGFS
jgi:hypothetical protein